MADKISNELIYEVLKNVQSDLSTVKGDVSELKGDVEMLKNAVRRIDNKMSSMNSYMAGFYSQLNWQEEEMVSHRARLEALEEDNS